MQASRPLRMTALFDRSTTSAGRRAGNGQRLDKLNHLPLRHLELSRDDGFVPSVNPRSTAAQQLCGPECGQDRELKRTNAWRALNHKEPPEESSALNEGHRDAG